LEKEKIVFYEEALKQYVMTCMISNNVKTLKQYMIELIEENRAEYKLINYAFLSVRKELLG